MTKEDMDGLWKLLGIYRKNDHHLNDKVLKSAYLLVLEPYDPKDVREAVAAHFRVKQYWPDVSEIAMGCPKLPEPQKVQALISTPAREDMEKYNQQMDEMLELGEMMERDYLAAGLPHPAQARGMGWSCKEWISRCREATECPA